MSQLHRIGIVLLVGCAFVVGSIWPFAAAQSEKPRTTPKWELTKVARSAEGWAQSQELAGEGWELVAVDVTAYYLKRPK